MKAASVFLALLLPVLAPAQTPAPAAAPAPGAAPAGDLRQLLQDGLFEEEANRNLEKAAASYEALLERFAQERQFAATAVFRLAEIRLKQNRKEDAVALFQRVVAEFGNDPLAKLSRDRIAGLGGTVAAGAMAGASDREAEWIEFLKDLVKGSPDLLNAPGEDKMTPIRQAAREGWLKAATFLLDHGADLGARFGTPALNEAALAGRKAMVELLLARGADINSKDAQGVTPLLEAVANRRVEVARLLLEKGALPNERTGANYSPLHAACKNGDVELARLLIEKGAEVDVVCTEREARGTALGTPLMLALRGRHNELAKLLLERKADVNVKMPEGDTALSVVPQEDHATIALLLEHGANPNVRGIVTAAVSSKNIELLRLLAKHGANLNEKGADGRAPLHIALESLAMTRALLDLGASPAVKATTGGATPLHAAIGQFRQNDSSAQPAGALPPAVAPPRPREASQRARAPSEQNAEVFEVCKLLVDRGADVNAPDSGGYTPLHRALAHPAVPIEVVEWLLARGADINASDNTAQRLTPAETASVDRRLLLEQRTLFPQWAKERAIHTVFRFAGKTPPSEPHRYVPLAEFDLPPRADEAVRAAAAAIKDGEIGVPTGGVKLLVYRANQQGLVENVAKTYVNPGPPQPNLVRHRATLEPTELPTLQWGDVVVLTAVGNNSGWTNLETLRAWREPANQEAKWHVTVQLGERERKIALVPGELKMWSPATDEFPEWKLSDLVAHVAGAEPRAHLGAVKVQREVDGKTKEWEVDLRPNHAGAEATNPPKRKTMTVLREINGRTVQEEIELPADQLREEIKSFPARLASGDRLIIPLLPPNAPEALAARRTGIYRAAPDRIFGERVFHFTKDDDAPRTLGDLLAESYLRSPMVIPEPDLARIRIHRLTGDAEETVEVDLAAAVERVGAETSNEEARKLDVRLERGDIVEIPTRAGADLEQWTGLSGPARRFLTKALARVVKVQPVPGDAKTVGLNAFFRDFRRSKTKAGWEAAQAKLPFPFRALAATDWGDNLRNLFKVRLTSGGRAREFSGEEFVAVNPWLVDGDQLVLERY